jgi:hypothetical protein
MILNLQWSLQLLERFLDWFVEVTYVRRIIQTLGQKIGMIWGVTLENGAWEVRLMAKESQWYK